jgi:predicted dehydrogenase
MVEHARGLVHDGRIGALYVVHGRYAADIAFSAAKNWRRFADAAGPSYATADLGTHWTDLVEHVTRLRIEDVFAEFRSFADSRPDAGEDYAALLCRLETGAAATAHFSTVSAGRKSDCVLECEGSAGGLTWSANAPNELLLRPRTGPSTIVTKDDLSPAGAAAAFAQLPAGLVEGYRGAFENVFRNAYRAMAGDRGREYPSFADGYRGLRVLDAVIRSARGGEWVSIDPA